MPGLPPPPPHDIGGSNGGRPSRSNIFQFHALFRKKIAKTIGWRPHLCVTRPTSVWGILDPLLQSMTIWHLPITTRSLT